MNNLFQDINKIKSYTEIQNHLIDLKPNASEDEIQGLINQIPENFLKQKNDLLMICQLFAHYAKFTSYRIRGNAIKLFEKIKDPMKNLLGDESYFLNKIFNGFYYFKLIMYEDRLITIDDIIKTILRRNSSPEAEYFLPEIIKERPEIFENDIKFLIKSPYSKDYLEKLNTNRQKHIKWIRSSCDFNDSLYQEIETNQLRLSIKTDDIDTFQKIFSSSNLSIDSQIEESIFDNYLPCPQKINLIELVINYDSIKIFKFLIMNSINISEDLNFLLVSLHNNEIIHIIESLLPEQFASYSIFSAIGCWNVEFHEYLINTTSFDYLEKSEVSNNFDQTTLKLIYTTVCSCNFIFFNDYLLPFLRQNSRFVNNNFNEIVIVSMPDYSCFFFNEYLNDPRFNINYCDAGKTSILTQSIIEENSKATKILFQNENLDISTINKQNFGPFHAACKVYTEDKTLKLFLDHPKFDVNLQDDYFGLNAFEFAVVIGNFYFAHKIYDECLSIKCKLIVMTFLITNNKLISLKLLMKKYIESNINITLDSLIDSFIQHLIEMDEYKEEYKIELSKIQNELNKKVK